MAKGIVSNKVAITFSKKQFAWLNAYAGSRGCSFAAAVRAMVDMQIKRMGEDGWRLRHPVKAA